jgi:hypothetical protein
MLLIGSVISTAPPFAAAPAAQGVAVPVVFGSDRGNPNRRHKADLFLSSFATKDNDVSPAAGARGVVDPRLGGDALYSALQGVVSYRRKTARTTLSADAGSTLHYHPQLNNTFGDYGAGATLQGRLRRRTEISATQRVTYFQNYRMSVIPPVSDQAVGAVPAAYGGEALSRLEAFSSMTSLRVTQTLSTKTSADIASEFQSVDFVNGGTDLRTWGAGGRVTRRLNRSVALQAGYGQRHGRYGASSGGPPTRIHDVNVNIDYRGQRTTVSVRPGSSIVDDSQGRQYRAAGEVAINRRLGKAWSAGFVYRRSSEFVEGFADPFFLDAATVGLTGRVSRRIELSTWAGYSSGVIGLWDESNGPMSQAPYESYSGSARANVSMNRQWAVTLEYLYYNHQFAGDIHGPAPAALDRHSMRVGMRWWSPLR